MKGDLEPKSSQEWVELLVQQMAGAKDLDDARSRASQMLQAFEQAVLQQASQVRTSLQLVFCVPERSGAQDPQSLVGAILYMAPCQGPIIHEDSSRCIDATSDSSVRPHAGPRESRGSSAAQPPE